MQNDLEHLKFGKQFSYIVLVDIIDLLAGIILIPIITRRLGTTLYGTWSLINVTISLIVPFSVLSLGSSIIRFLSAEKNKNIIREDFISACSIVIITSCILSILLFYLSNPLATFVFKDVNASQYIRLASILIFLNAFSLVIQDFLRMRQMIGLYTLFNLVMTVIQFVLTILFLIFNLKLVGVIYAVIISLAIWDLALLAIVIKQIGFKIPRFTHIKSYLLWGIPLVPNAAILWIITASDKYMVSYFLGDSAAGIYNAAYSIAQFVSFALMPLSIVLFPYIVKTYNEGRLDETKRYLKYSTKYLMMIAIPSAFGLSVLSKQILGILTTPDFVKGHIIVPFVAFGIVLFCFYQITSYILSLVNKNHINFWFLIIAAALNLIFNIVLIPRIGIVGSALAALIAYGTLALCTLLITRRYLKFDLNISFIFKCIFCSFIMSLFIWVYAPVSWINLSIAIILGITIYFLLLFLLRGFTKAELAYFISFFRNTVTSIFKVKT